MTGDELITEIVESRRDFLRLVDQLGADADRTPLTEDGWTAKDLLAHLIHWTGQMAFGLGAKMTPPPWVVAASGERVDGDDAWNARVVEHHRETPIGEVRRAFEADAERLIEQLRSRDDIDLRASATRVMPWAADRPLGELIASETSRHWRAHEIDLDRALTRST